MYSGTVVYQITDCFYPSSVGCNLTQSKMENTVVVLQPILEIFLHGYKNTKNTSWLKLYFAEYLCTGGFLNNAKIN